MQTENFVPMVVPGLSSSSSTSPSQDSSSTPSSTPTSPASERSDKFAPGNWSRNPTRDANDSNDLLRDLPEWLEEFADNLEDAEMPAPAHFSWLRFGTAYQSAIKKHSILLTSQKTEVAISACANQNCKGSLQETHWYSRAQSGNFGDLTTADHKVLSEGCESRNNHRYEVVTQDLATQWTQSYPCKTTTSQEDGKELAEVLGADQETKSPLHWQFIGIWQSCEELTWITVRQRRTDRKWMDCWESGTQN